MAAPTYTYGYGANPPVDYPRLLISDTGPTWIFADEEINSAFLIQQNQFQSSMFFSTNDGRYLPALPVSYLRVAALLLDSLASNKARLSSITQLLDVHLDPSKAAKALQDQAAAYRATDDDAGAFAIIEQCPTQWAFEDRYWKQVQRQSGGGGLG